MIMKICCLGIKGYFELSRKGWHPLTRPTSYLHQFLLDSRFVSRLAALHDAEVLGITKRPKLINFFRCWPPSNCVPRSVASNRNIPFGCS